MIDLTQMSDEWITDNLRHLTEDLLRGCRHVGRLEQNLRDNYAELARRKAAEQGAVQPVQPS